MKISSRSNAHDAEEHSPTSKAAMLLLARFVTVDSVPSAFKIVETTRTLTFMNSTRTTYGGQIRNGNNMLSFTSSIKYKSLQKCLKQ